MANIKDFAVGLVVTPPSPATTGTTLTLRTGEAATMPAVPFYVTATPPGQLTTIGTSEKLLVTAKDISTDIITFTRAQSPTSAKSIAANWIIANAMYVDDVLSSNITLGGSFTGTIDGINSVFTMPVPATAVTVYKNGVRMKSGSGNDYVFSLGNTITFESGAIPSTGSVLTYDAIIGSQVMVNGSNSLVYLETPTGLINGLNKLYTLARGYVPGTLEVFVNGLRSSKVHYVETNPTAGTFTMDEALLAGDIIDVNYMFTTGASGNADTLDGFHLNTIMDAMNPIGTIYTNKTNATNPATLLQMPWSTWVALPGRVIVGKAASGTFATAGGTMGTETETLSIAQVPNVSGSIGLHGGENGSFFVNVGGAFSAPNGYTGQYKAPPGSTAGSQSVLNSIVFNNGGGGGSHNNIQPSLVAYMWERTA